VSFVVIFMFLFLLMVLGSCLRAREDYDERDDI
jgi:hypothetical protein